MGKFKIGDRVVIDHRRPGNLTGVVDYDKPNGDAGTVGVITRQSHSSRSQVERIGDGEYLGWFADAELRLAPAPEWEGLEAGDILIDADGDEREVRAVLGPIVFIRGYHSADSAPYDVDRLQEMRWTIKGAEPETTELTMSEIAEKFGVDVANLKIKLDADA